MRLRLLMNIARGYAGTEEQIVELLGLPSAEAHVKLRRWTSSPLTPASRDCLTAELAAADGELGEALLAFCSALNADPASPLAIAGYLYILDVSDPGGRQLVSELRTLSSNNPDLQRPRFWLGAALKRAAPQEAAKELEACVTQFPQDFQAWGVLAEVRSILHDTDGARKAVLTALAGTSDPSRRSSRLRLLYGIGFRREALRLAIRQARESRSIRGMLMPVAMPLAGRIKTIGRVLYTALSMFVGGGLLAVLLPASWIGRGVSALGIVLLLWWVLSLYATDLLAARRRMKSLAEARVEVGHRRR